MIKKFRQKEYAIKAQEANKQGKQLYVLTKEETPETVVEVNDEGTPTEKEIFETVAELVIAEPDYYICYKDNWTDGTINENWEKEKEEAERTRLNMLSLTKREVFLALYRNKGITPEQLRAQIQSAETLIEFDFASEYFRGNPLINSIGAMLGYTTKQLDYLFEHKEFEKESEE